MATVRITKTELERDLDTVLARVRDEGVEVIVVEEHHPVAIIMALEGPSPELREQIELEKKFEERLGPSPVGDDASAGDVQGARSALRNLPTPVSESDPEQETGEVAAALKNRELSARLQIIGSLQRLGIPHSKWPDFVKSFYGNPQEGAGYSACIAPPPFQAPEFDQLKQSYEQWEKAADKAWKQHRKQFIQRFCQYAVTLGVDQEIPPAKRRRGTGRTGRNAPPRLRFEWAARRLSGAAWKEIAGASFQEDHVKKAASEVLKEAGWPTKVKLPKARKTKPKSRPKPHQASRNLRPNLNRRS
jgi:antitoxin (DNA-binding transcriptional repressor) of toxin-antitoxin stability system